MRTWPMMPGVPAAGHVTAGGAWHPGQAEGCVKCPKVNVIQRSDIQRCPRKSLSASHYRDNGTCRCVCGASEELQGPYRRVCTKPPHPRSEAHRWTTGQRIRS